MTLNKEATQGRRILNDNIRKDYKRLLSVITDVREPDFPEVEELANKYRMYFDDNGDVKELSSDKEAK